MEHISIATTSQAASSHSASQDRCLPIGNAIVLHLLPGALITAFCFLAAPVLVRAGFPPIMMLYLAILLILIPFELGFLFYQGKKLNRNFSLDGIVLCRERTPIWQMILIILALFGWSGLVFGLFPKLDTLIAQPFFAWIPQWPFPLNAFNNLSLYSEAAKTITIVSGFLLNGIAGPVVEELYFRGYLLPRIPSSKPWRPLINILLFSLYHFFAPWQNLTRILVFLPLSYAVAWKRNLYISIGAHCLMNTATMIIALAS